MTVPTEYAPIQYTGNGVTTVFAFPYVFFNSSDLIVTLTLISSGANTVQSIGTNYTISGGSGASGSITMIAAPSSLYRLTIEMSLPYTQSDDYVENQAFPAETLESGFDKAAIRDQQLKNAVSRSLKFPATISGTLVGELPQPEDGKALIWSGVGGAVINSNTYIADAVASATTAVTGASLVTATSTSSLSVTSTSNKTWVTQASKGFALGMRLRASSADGTKINEGKVTSYSGTSLVINVDYVSGTGTHADWYIGVVGDRGATGGGTGDMLAVNNLSELTSKPTAFATIKQAASDTVTGVVELATNAETITGTDTLRAVTPAGLAAVVSGVGVKLQTTLTPTTTSADFTSIPTNVKRINMMLDRISTNGGTGLGVRLGSTTFATSGYTGCSSVNTSGVATGVFSNSFNLTVSSGSSAAWQFTGIITFEHMGSNVWVMQGGISNTVSTVLTLHFSGSVTLAGVLDRIQLRTENGTDIFDNGTVTISWEF